MNVLLEIEQPHLRKQVPSFEVGDTVDVHVKIREGEKERVQLFNGIVIRRRGRGIAETFTVRRIVQGEGVERIFPIHAPSVVDVIVKKRGRVRRAKLYYLRKRVGKGTRVREQLWTKSKAEATPATTAAATAPVADSAATAPVTDASTPAAPPVDHAAVQKQEAEATAKKADAAAKKADAERKARAKAKKASRRDAKAKKPAKDDTKKADDKKADAAE